jgi:hypothetical protein
MVFDLKQDFEVNCDKPARIKLALEARVIGLLRSHKHGGGSARVSAASVALLACGVDKPLLEISLPDHAVAGGENLSINDQDGPCFVGVPPGKYTLVMHFAIEATNPRCTLPCKAASAEFAPDPALDPLWISYWEPFHGANKKDFGFRATLRASVE